MAFPNHDNFEALGPQPPDCIGIPNSVHPKFARPEINVRLGRRRTLATCVGVPEAAIRAASLKSEPTPLIPSEVEGLGMSGCFRDSDFALPALTKIAHRLEAFAKSGLPGRPLTLRR